MSKMTDEQIIKALECCIKLNAEPRNWEICKKDCPYKFNCCDKEKGIYFEKDVLDLINRQQAENKELKTDKIIAERKEKDARDLYKDVVIQLQEQNTEIERLNSCVKSEDEVRAIANATIQAGIKIIKAEVIKEFAEKYEKVLLSMLTTATLEKKEIIYSCLDTLEEMVGKER
jgi:hypothetical protein